VSLEGLLLTKQTAREKDIQDRLVLERALIELSRIADADLPTKQGKSKN